MRIANKQGKCVGWLWVRVSLPFSQKLSNAAKLPRAHCLALQMIVWSKKPRACNRQECILQRSSIRHFYASVAWHSSKKNTQINFLLMRLLQFQIWAESTKLFLKYLPSNFIIFSSYLSFFATLEINITCTCFNGLPWN